MDSRMSQDMTQVQQQPVVEPASSQSPLAAHPAEAAQAFEECWCWEQYQRPRHQLVTRVGARGRRVVMKKKLPR
jgi:hypothetical protein